VPKASKDILLGEEMRDLFVVDKGCWYVGTDASSLENFCLASYTYKYDDGAFAKRQLEGDGHSFTAFAFFPHLYDKFDINDETLKDNPDFKPYRAKAKTGAYLLAFGGGAPKLASSLGLSKARGKEAYDNYWLMNAGLGKLKEAVEAYYNTTGQQRYIVGKDGRIVFVRGKNVLISCLGQGLGAIAMSYAACFLDQWFGELHLDELGRPHYLFEGKKVSRISMFHDEYSWQVEDGVQEEVTRLTVEAIRRAGKALKMDLPLDGEGKMSFEGTWKDVH
jgi:DNA polymerase family A